MKTYKTPIVDLVLFSTKTTILVGSNNDQLNVYSEKVIDNQEDALSNSNHDHDSWDD